MYRLILTMVLFLSSIGAANADLLDPVRATARIHVKRLNPKTNAYSMATGTAWLIETEAEKEGTAYLITAGHMFATDFKEVWVEFFYPERMALVKGTMIMNTYHRIDDSDKLLHTLGLVDMFFASVNQDVGVVSIPTDKIKHIKTRLRLAKAIPNKGDRVISIGCANSNPPSMIWGKVDMTFSTGFRFNAEVQGGRSGSVVMDSNGDEVLGIVLRQDSSCVSAKRIKELISFSKKKPASKPVPVGKAGLQTTSDGGAEQGANNVPTSPNSTTGPLGRLFTKGRVRATWSGRQTR